MNFKGGPIQTLTVDPFLTTRNQAWIQLRSENILTLGLAVVVTALIVLSVRGKKKIAERILVPLFFFVPWITRFLSDGYAYDTAFALLSQLSDIAILAYCCFLLGGIVADGSRAATRVSIGLAMLTGFGLASTFLGLNRIAGHPHSITNFLFVVFMTWLALRNFPRDSQRTLWERFSIPLFVLLLFSYGFNEYLVVPAPPDADITSQAEMLGYLYQGQNLNRIETGFGEEWTLRYPAGFSSVAFVSSHLLNIRASETMLLFWYLSFFLFILNLIYLAKKLAVNSFLIGLFSLNGVITGSGALKGGEVHEMLTYALGLAMITLLLERQLFSAAVCLGGAIVLQPVIALPFCLVFGVLLITNHSSLQIGTMVKSAVVLSACMGYIAYLGLGPSSTPSQPQILLSELSPAIFLSNIVQWFREDSLGYGVFFLSIPILSVLSKKFPQNISEPLLFCYPWFVGCILIDGLFGHTHWSLRFQKSFNLIGLWILSVGLSYRLWTFSWDVISKEKTANIAKEMKRKKSAPRTIAPWKMIPAAPYLAGFGVLLIVWFLAAARHSTIQESPIFATNATIRMGRFIEKHLPENSLIHFKRLTNTWDELNMVRGDSSRNTVLGRITEHHIKSGPVKSRNAVTACFTPQSLSEPTVLAKCLKDSGVTHLVLDTSEDLPETRDIVKRLAPLVPKHQVGATYLFELNP